MAAKTVPSGQSTRGSKSKESDLTNRVRWDLYRRELPELRLAQFPGGDDLSFLFWGNPDAKQSFATYVMVQKRLGRRDFGGAATCLLDLVRANPFTFHISGWVFSALGVLVLEDEAAIQQFSKGYRQSKRIRPKQCKAK